MKSAFLALAISILHFVVGLWLFTKSFAYAFSAVDIGRQLTLIEKINYIVVEILLFPIVTLFENTTYEGTTLFTQYFPFMLNSALWGIFITYGYNIILYRNN